MKEIKLGKTNKYTIIDDGDFDLVNKYKWHFGANRYAMSREKGKKIYLHRFINQTPKGFDTDHINHNTLDNRRGNLRTASRSENNINSGLRSDNTSGYKGVYWNRLNKNWRVLFNWKKKHLEGGSFKNLQDAILSRKNLEAQYYGN